MAISTQSSPETVRNKLNEKGKDKFHIKSKLNKLNKNPVNAGFPIKSKFPPASVARAGKGAGQGKKDKIK